MSLVEKVKTNLSFYNLWTEISEVPTDSETLVRGRPHEKISEDDFEIVLPIHLNEKLTMERIDNVFKSVSPRPKKILLGVVNTDSTIVYYFIHDGISKPKK